MLFPEQLVFTPKEVGTTVVIAVVVFAGLFADAPTEGVILELYALAAVFVMDLD